MCLRQPDVHRHSGVILLDGEIERFSSIDYLLNASMSIQMTYSRTMPAKTVVDIVSDPPVAAAFAENSNEAITDKDPMTTR